MRRNSPAVSLLLLNTGTMDVFSESGAVFTPEVWRSATARRPSGVDHKLSTVSVFSNVGAMLGMKVW